MATKQNEATERKPWHVALLWLVACGVLSGPAVVGAAEEVVIALEGEARLPVVVSPEAGETVRAAADDLAAYLGRISGGDFQVREGSGAKGLVLGVPKNLDETPFETDFGEGPFERDHYLIRSTKTGLYLLGATPAAAEFAVWDLLHEFGYRYYFPSPRWEIIPERKNLRLSIDRYERPDYYNRGAPRGAMRRNLRPWSRTAWTQWRIRNRTKSSFDLHTGHAYGSIIRRHRKEFEEHPEYLALVDGERGGSKFCISNEGLRELIVQDAVTRIKKNPGRDSVSLDPSDGGGWCECEECRQMGSVTDRVVILANQAAEAINRLGYGDKYVGIYAYNVHSPPPTVEVHPKVIVSLATAFIRGDQTFEQMLEGWSEKTHLIGIREYYGVPVWNSSMPGAARAGRWEYIARTIPEFHAAGARFMNAESDGAWGPNGLGYYLGSRLMWDVDASPRQIVDDFLSRCFGASEKPMREFCAFINGRPRYSEHMVGRMYRLLRAAREQAEEPGVIQRIDDLVLYARYVELHRDFNRASPNRDVEPGKALQMTEDPRIPGDEGDLGQQADPVIEDPKQAAFDELVRFLWRSRTHMMPDAIGVFYYLNRQQRGNPYYSWIPGKDRSMAVPPERLRRGGDQPFSEEEIRRFINEGIEHNEVLDFTPKSYGRRLAPAQEALNLPEVPPVGRPYGGKTRGQVKNYTWIDKAPRTVRLRAKTGLVYDWRGPLRVSFARWEDEEFRHLQTVEVPPDQKWHEVEFTFRQEGLHRISWNERMSGSRVEWPEGLRLTTRTDERHVKGVVGRHSWYFYVPKGTEVVGAYARARAGGLYNAEGELVVNFKELPRDYVSVPVPEGQDGKLWKIHRLAGKFRLLTVPPYGAGSAEDLLLPVEVIERNGR